MCENANCILSSRFAWTTRSPITRNWAAILQNDTIQFLSLDDVIAIQAHLVQRFGGTTDVGNRGLWGNASFRPQTGYYEDFVKWPLHF